MFTLIIPVAGKSSRFPEMRPKWLLTMPDGKLMVEKSIENIDINLFDRVVLVCLKEHLDKYVDLDLLKSSFFESFGKNIDFSILNSATDSQSETISQGLAIANVTGAFFIKDCDNKFSCVPTPGNLVASVNLDKVDLIDAKNKSYIEYDSLGVISNIVEKQVVSNSFCCGGYGFNSVEEFQSAYESIKSEGEGEVYISHVIYKMILDGINFRNLPANEYVDWGTLREYRHFCKSYITVFCDVDGVLLYNGGKFSENGWKTSIIKENVEKLIGLQKKGLLYLVLTSSRPEPELNYTLNTLSDAGLYVDKALFGLPHTSRYLINDYSPTNPYPSAVAINMIRDTGELKNLLNKI